jgi:hypothetical protein
MKFENDEGWPVEINFQNFESILLGAKAGLTHVKLKNGREEWLKATKDESIEVSAAPCAEQQGDKPNGSRNHSGFGFFT